MRRGGIRRRIIVAVTLLFVVSFSLLGAFLAVMIYQNEKRELTMLQREIAAYSANEMHWDIHELEALLGLAAEQYDWSRRNGITIAGFLSQILTAEHVKHHNIVEELSLIDETGRERDRVSRTKVFLPADMRILSGTDEFDVPKESGQTYFGPVSFEKGTNIPYMTMSLPIVDMSRGVTHAVLLAKLRLHKTWANAVERTIGKAGIVFITDEKGKVLAHPDPSVIYRNTFYTPAGPEGVQEGLNGSDVLLVSKKVEMGNRTFIVYTSLPLAEVLELSFNALTALGVFFLLFLGFSISFSLAAVNRLTRPIEALADNARKITAGDLNATAAVEGDGEIGELSGALRVMTSRLTETIYSLEQRNELVNNVLNALTHPFYVINTDDYTIEMANPAARLGAREGKVTCYALTHNNGAPCSEDDHPCVIREIGRTGRPVTVEHVHFGPDGERRIYEVHGYPVHDREGKIVQVIEYNIDVTERKIAEDALQMSEQKNRSITTTAKDAIIMVDEEGRILFWNPAAETIFGYGEEEMLGCELHDILVPKDYHEDYRKGMEKFREEGEGAAVGQTIEMNARRKDGSEFPVELSLSAFQMKNKWHAVGVVRDITQRKQAEKKILESLEEKELLLQEIHHRVKNNLQVISSLLDLQLGYVRQKEPKEVFTEIKNRIKSMALVHEKLYHAKDLSKVDFRDYLETLINNLYRFYNVNPERVRLDLVVNDVSLGIDTAIPCGLIVNELITNALKYAFPESRRGALKVALRKTGESERGEGEYEMIVRDDGVGMPENLKLDGVKTLGLYLVTTLVEHQLRGSIDLRRGEGAEFLIRFRELKYKKRI